MMKSSKEMNLVKLGFMVVAGVVAGVGSSIVSKKTHSVKENKLNDGNDDNVIMDEEENDMELTDYGISSYVVKRFKGIFDYIKDPLNTDTILVIRSTSSALSDVYQRDDLSDIDKMYISNKTYEISDWIKDDLITDVQVINQLLKNDILLTDEECHEKAVSLFIDFDRKINEYKSCTFYIKAYGDKFNEWKEELEALLFPEEEKEQQD